MSKQVLTATALALLIGVGGFGLRAALAQNGGEARSNDRAQQKKLDDRDLTPVRPIRRVGEDGWPAAKDQPAARETTGQSTKESAQAKEAAPAKKEAKKEEKKEKKESTAQNTAKPEPKNPNLGNQSPPPDKPQDTAKQNAQPKQDTAKQDKPDNKQSAKQESAKPDTKQAQQPAAQQNDKQDTAQNKDDKDVKGFASIRLGTDESGRVSINDSQQRQIATVMRKHHVETVNVKVSVGSVAPANVRLVAMSSDFIDVFPQFRGYSYFATADDVVIVEPSTRKVVALVPAKLTATASRPAEQHNTRAEPAARPDVRTTSRRPDRQRDTDISGVPTEAEILAAPAARAPAGTTVTRTYRTYRYEPYYDDGDDDVVVIERRPRPRFFRPW